MPTSVFTAEGNVSGPSSSTDSGFAQWDGTTGTLLKNHAATIAIGSEVSGLGTNVATALGVAIGSAGAPVVLNGALGTPASGTLTNTTGFPTASLAGAGTGVLTFLATPSGANFGSMLTGTVPIAQGGTGAATFKAAGLVAAANLKNAVVAGATAGDITVTGVAVGDQLVAVVRFIGAGVAVTDVTSLTAEFTITGTNTINNTGGTNTTGDKLEVWWVDLT